MRLIFSRKGIDKSSGGMPSPICPDGALRSLPFPLEWDEKHRLAPPYRIRYKELSCDTKDLGSVVEDLSRDQRKGKPRLKGTDFCHLDPDLIRGDLARKAGWLPMFGQAKAAAAHLLNHGVREGDLFLFFGWFQRVRDVEGHFRLDAAKQDAHVIFGWLQIAEIWCMFEPDAVLPKWAKYHPHVCGEVDEFYNLSKPVNVVFVAKRHLDLPGIKRRLPGGGVFKTFHSDLCLSSRGKRKSLWRLPGWMYPVPRRTPLTYHPDRTKWKKSGKWTILQTVGRGQEFVLDLDAPGYPEKYPADEAYKWLAQLFRHAR